MRVAIKRNFLLLAIFLLFIIMFQSTQFESPEIIHAQGDTNLITAACERIKTRLESEGVTFGQDNDIYCVNTPDDASDYSYITFANPEERYDGRCDSDNETPGDQCTLRAAIQEASSPPASVSDYIFLAPGTYVLSIEDEDPIAGEESGETGDLDILSSVTLVGESKEQVTIDANGIDRAFHNRYNSQVPTDVTISDVTITNGALPTRATRKGGGVYNEGILTLRNVVLKDYNDAGIYNIVNSSSLPGRLVLSNTLVMGGGEEAETRTGIWVAGGDVLLDNSTVTNNFSNSDGAGIYIEGSRVRRTSVTLKDSTISNNTAYDKKGGGIYSKDTKQILMDIYIYRSTIANNLAKDGGGFYADSGDLSPFKGEIRIDNSTFSGNIAQDKNDSDGKDPRDNGQSNSGRGGGIVHHTPMLMRIYNSTISNNEANANGGGLFVGGTSNVNMVRRALITNTTIAYNIANADRGDHGDGGGIFLFPWYDFRNGIYMLVPEKSGKATIKNSIIAANLDASGFDLDQHPDCSQCNKKASHCAPDGATSVGYNLMGENFGCEINFPVDGDEYPRLTGGFIISFTEYANRQRFQPRSVYSDWNGDFPSEPTFPFDSDGQPPYEGGTYEVSLCPSRTILNNNHNFYLNRTNSQGLVVNNDSEIGDWVGTRREDDDCANLSGKIDPRLLPLRSNGGPIETHALLTSDEPSNVVLEKRSFAIDSGECADTGFDQRGAKRGQDGDNSGTGQCDIGAYEVLPNDVSVFISNVPDQVASNQSTDYIIEFYNQGSKTLTNVFLQHVIPPELTSVSISYESDDGVKTTPRSGNDTVWDISDLKPGDSGKILISGIVDPGLDKFVVMNYAATIDATNDPSTGDARDDNMHDNNVYQVDVSALPGADLEVVLKSNNSVTAIKQPFGYTIVITNHGPAVATSILVENPLPTDTNFRSASSGCIYDTKAKIVECRTNLLGVGSSEQFDVEILPNKAMTMTLGAKVESSYPDPFPVEPHPNSDQKDIAVLPDVDLSIEMNVAPEQGEIGENLTYNITVLNSNDSQTAENIILDASWSKEIVDLDTVSPGKFKCTTNEVERTLRCTLASLARNRSESMTVKVKPYIGGIVNAIALLSGGGADKDLGNNKAELNTSISGATANVDLAIQSLNSSPNPVTVNETLSYQVTVINNGSEAAQNLLLSTNLPTGVTYQANGSSTECQNNGQTVECSVASLGVGVEKQFIVNVVAQNSGSLTGRFEVTNDKPDKNLNDNVKEIQTTVNPSTQPTGTATATATSTPSPSPTATLIPNVETDIMVSATVPLTGKVGNQLTYNLQVANNSSQDTAQTVTLKHHLSASFTKVSVSDTTNCSYQFDAEFNSENVLVCTWSTVAAGESKTVDVVIVPEQAGNLESTSTVSSGTTDPNTSNNKIVKNVTINSASNPPGTIPSLGSNPTFFLFQSDGGTSTVPSKQLTIRNDGEGLLQWQVTADVEWLVFDKETGLLNNNDNINSQTVNVSINTRGLKKGRYSGKITITSLTANTKNSPNVADVSFILKNDGSNAYISTEVIEPVGGSIVSTDIDKWVQLQFFAGGVTADTTVTLLTGEDAPYPATGNLKFLHDRAFVVTAERNGTPITDFVVPYAIKVKYDDDHFQGITTDEKEIDLYYWNTTQQVWQQVYDGNCICNDPDYDYDSNIFTIEVDHMTHFALMAGKRSSNNIYLPVVVK